MDGGGRTWGRQVGDVAADLAAWLARNGHPIRVHTAVMLMHEHAVVARCERPAVDLVSARPDRLLTAILARPPALSPRTRGPRSPTSSGATTGSTPPGGGERFFTRPKQAVT